MKFFTNTPVAVADTNIPIGAYTMFVIPEEKKWTLIISKSTDTSGKYDEQQDLTRIPMQFGTLAEAEPEFTAISRMLPPINVIFASICRRPAPGLSSKSSSDLPLVRIVAKPDMWRLVPTSTVWAFYGHVNRIAIFPRPVGGFR